MAGQGDSAQRKQLLILALGAVGLGILYWQFLYSPLTEEKQKEEANFKRMDKENRDLKAEARIQSAMIKCRPELEALNRQNELMLPTEAEAVTFLKNLTNMAGAAGLRQGPTSKLSEANVKAPPDPAAKKKGKGKKGDGEADDADKADDVDKPCWEKIPGLKASGADAGFVRVPFQIEVRGTFHQLTKYFWMLHEHAKAGRIITVENLELSDPKGSSDGVLLTATFTAVGFREGDKAKDDKKKAAAAASKAADKAAAAADKAADKAAGDAAAKAKATGEAAAAQKDAQAETAGEGGQPSNQQTGTPAASGGAAPADPSGAGVDRPTKPGAP